MLKVQASQRSHGDSDVNLAIIRENIDIASQDVLGDIIGASIQAGKSYLVEAFVHFSAAGAASGAVFGFAGVAAAFDLTFEIRKAANPGVIENLVVLTSTGASAAVTADAGAGDYVLVVHGYIKTATGGDFKLKAAQNESDPAAITIHAGSHLQLLQID